MAISSEKNSDLELKDSIVVKLPSDPFQKILTFPFLHQLKSNYENADLHLISDVTSIEILNLLPFSAFYHECTEGDLKSIFHAHRFIVNSKIYKADVFISLTDSVPDAMMGLFLKSKRRVGFAGKWKNELILNNKILRPSGIHKSEEYLELLKNHLSMSDIKKNRIISRDLPPLKESWALDQYIAINLNSPENDLFEDHWVSLVSQFENQVIVFYSDFDQEKINFLLNTLKPRLSSKNRYEFFIFKNQIELAKMLSNARGVITFDGFGTHLAAYCGAKTVSMTKKYDPRLYGPNFYLADVAIVNCQESLNMGLVADKAHEFFKI